MFQVYEPVEELSEDGDVMLLYVGIDYITITDDDGNVVHKIPVLPGYKAGLMYDQ